MRKISLIVIALLTVISFTMAQADEQVQGQTQTEVLKSKRGVPILPTKGAWAIGIDASPMLTYVGNMFTGGANAAPNFGFTAQNPTSIYGKYMKSSKITYRGTLLIGYSSETDKTANGINPDLTDKTTISALNIGLILGLEKHRSMFGRIVGNYGVQAGVSKTPYNNAGTIGKVSYKDGDDTSFNFKQVGGNTIEFLAGAFVGIEFFIAPKISIGGEFDYNFSFSTQMKRKFVPNTGSEVVTDLGEIGVDFAPGASGNLQMLFYF